MAGFLKRLETVEAWIERKGGAAFQGVVLTSARLLKRGRYRQWRRDDENRRP